MKTFLYECMVVCTILFSCTDPATKAKINTSFITNPPAINDLQASISKNSLQITAHIPEEKSNFHVFLVGEDQFVLRDDGRKGDSKKGDKIFSITLDDKKHSINESIKDRIEELKLEQSKNSNLFRFEGRHAIPIDIKMINDLDLDFKNNRILKLPGFMFLPIGGNFAETKTDHSLMITAPSVVEDISLTFNPCNLSGNPNGPWTFKTLVTNMANESVTGMSPHHLIKNWLKNWIVDKAINGDIVDNRANAIWSQVIRPWMQRSNPAITIPNNPSSDLKLSFVDSVLFDLNLAPFKLLAIVNRMDLGGVPRYGSSSNGGEGRFVFGVLNIDPLNPAMICNPLPFTVIFEYNLPISSCAEIKSYAQKWQSLSALELGNSVYDTTLSSITNLFTRANGCPGKPFGSCLNQIRTNEIAIGNPWELREFALNDSSVVAEIGLAQKTVAQEPRKIFNRIAVPSGTEQQILADFVNANEANVKLDKHIVPPFFGGLNFLGAKAHTENPDHFWDAVDIRIDTLGAILNDTARHHFSLNTCSGCHGGETSTFFLHITTPPFGTTASLSGFLTGITVEDAAGRDADWSFNDLLRRRIDLDQKARMFCKRPRFSDIIAALHFRKRKMVH